MLGVATGLKTTIMKDEDDHDIHNKVNVVSNMTIYPIESVFN